MANDTFSQSFCRRLREARNKAGFTQVEVGKRIGRQQNTVNDYESGKAYPPPPLLAQMATLYEVTIDYLLGRTDNPHPPVKGGEGMESVPDQRIEVLNRRLSILEGTVYVLERVVRSQLPITPAEWNRLLEQAAQHHADE